MLVSASDALEAVEDSLDSLAASLAGGGGGSVPRERLQTPVARLATMRRWVRAEQAIFQRVGLDIGALSGFDEPEERYLDRLDEQADRLLGSIDAASNVIGMVLDLQLNERAYLVSVVGTIFVPLTFVTGFFGMNFGWMVDRIDTQVAFWLLASWFPQPPPRCRGVSSCAASSWVTSADAVRGLHSRVDLHGEVGAHRHPRLCAPKRSMATNNMRTRRTSGTAGKRLKGLEPSTFCMASRTWRDADCAVIPANERFRRRG
jgi:hypothetical protein